jgi:predicted DNA-binding transcriptional regulator YafY
VPDTRVLHAWLLGFGGGVEVKKPAALRKVIAEAHKVALSRYASAR